MPPKRARGGSQAYLSQLTLQEGQRMKDSRFRKVERVLYDLPKLRVEVQNLRLDLEDAKEVVGIRGASGNEKAGSSTNAFSSVVENEVLQRDKVLEKKRQRLIFLIEKKKRDIQRIENVLSLLTEDEARLIEMRYFRRYSVKRICGILGMTEDGFNKKKKRLIMEILAPVFPNNL